MVVTWTLNPEDQPTKWRKLYLITGIFHCDSRWGNCHQCNFQILIELLFKQMVKIFWLVFCTFMCEIHLNFQMENGITKCIYSIFCRISFISRDLRTCTVYILIWLVFFKNVNKIKKSKQKKKKYQALKKFLNLFFFSGTKCLHILFSIFCSKLHRWWY